MLLAIPKTSQQNYNEVTFAEDVKGKIVHLCLQKDFLAVPDFSRITSVSVVPFIDRDTIVATQLERGVDIPGGHTEPYDADPAATAVREAAEEAAIELAQPLYVLGVISSDYKGPTDDDVTYMVIVAGLVSKINDFVPQFEALGREQITFDEFLKRYTAGSHEMMAELIHRAKGLSDEIFYGSRKR
jgi:8-oxo-dGTP diphosphatase